MTVQAIEGGKKYLFVVRLDYGEWTRENGLTKYGEREREAEKKITEKMDALGVDRDKYEIMFVSSYDVTAIPIDGDPLLIHDEGSAFEKMRAGHRDM